VHPSPRTPDYVNNSVPGATNGLSRGYQFSFYAVYYGTWPGKSVLLSLSSGRAAHPQEYSVEHLSPTQTAMLEDLRDYGIIWQRKVR
jgi:hypothetical protein